MKSSKIGRPIIGLPKTHDIKVRVDAETHEALVKYAEKENTTKAEVIRKAISLYLKK